MKKGFIQIVGVVVVAAILLGGLFIGSHNTNSNQTILGATTVPLGKNGTSEYLLYPTDSLSADNFQATSTSVNSVFPQFTFTRATGTSATTTNLFSTNASTTNLWLATGTGCLEVNSAGKVVTSTNAACGSGSASIATSSAETSGRVPFWTSTAATPATLSGGIAGFTFDGTILSTNQFLATGSSTLQNFTFINATGSKATTTNLFATTASTSNLFLGTGSGCLQATTAGLVQSTGSACGAGGSSFGQGWELTTNVFSQSALAPTTTQNIHVSGAGTSTFIGGLEAWRLIAAPYFHATSTTATSTFTNVFIENGEYGGDYIEDFTGTGLSVTNGVLNASTDADTLDSISSGSFLRSDASDSYTSGTLTFDAATLLDINSTGLSIADTSISFDGASTNFAITGDFSINTSNFFIEKDDGDICFNGIATTSCSFAFDVSLNKALFGTTGAGDKAWIYNNPSGIATWIHGLDDSDADAFVLANSGTLGTSNILRITSASTTILNAVENEADTTVYYAGSDFEVEAASRICGAATITTTPGNGILTLTPVAVPNSCTVQYSVPIPQKLHGEDVVIRSSTIYYTNADATSLIDVNQFVEYNATDGTVTTHDDDTTDITDSSTSHAQSNFPITLGISETGSSVIIRMTITFNTTTGAGNTFVLRGGKIVYDTD